MIHSKAGVELQNYIISILEVWVVAFGLMLSFLASLWGLLPMGPMAMEPHTRLSILIEGAFAGTAFVTLFTVLAMAILMINCSATTPTNMKAFAISNLGFLQLCEYLIATSLYSTFACVLGVLYLRLMAISKGDPGHSTTAVVVFLVVLAVAAVILQSGIYHVVATSRIVMHSGMMGDCSVVPEIQQNGQYTPDILKLVSSTGAGAGRGGEQQETEEAEDAQQRHAAALVESAIKTRVIKLALKHKDNVEMQPYPWPQRFWDSRASEQECNMYLHLAASSPLQGSNNGGTRRRGLVFNRHRTTQPHAQQTQPQRQQRRRMRLGSNACNVGDST